MKKLQFTLIALVGVTATHAQAVHVTDNALITPRFFVAIIAGVLLAVVFQFILTALSVALGITMIGDVKEHYVKAKVRPNDTDSKDDHSFDQDHDIETSMGVKVTSAIGIWSVVTSCIALFGATALALNLSVFGNFATDVTVALVIWALFFLFLFYLEAKLVNTVVGGLISTATSGLKASASAVTNLFTPSDASKMDTMIGTALDRIKGEFDSGFDGSKLSEVLDSFLTKVDKKIPDYDELKSDLEDIADKSGDKNSSGKWMAIQQVLTKAIDENSDKTDGNSKNKTDKLKQLLADTKKAYDQGDGKMDGVKNVISEFTAKDKEDIDKDIQSVKDYIAQATPDNFSKENLNKDIKKIIKDPKTIASIVSSKFKDFDKDSLVELLANNTNLDKEQLESYADQLRGAVESVTDQFDTDNDSNLLKQAEDRVAQFFDSTDQEELNYDDLKSDVMKLFDNPKDGFSIIKNRVKQFDGDTLKALVTNNKYVKESDIDKIVASIEDGKKQVEDKISQIEAKATQQVEMLKRKAVIQAEHTRRTAMSASWWLVITAITSAGAAILGGWVA